MSNESALKKIKDKVLGDESILKRIKVVKELFLEKLDHILAILSRLAEGQQKLAEEQQKLVEEQKSIQQSMNSMLENDSFFLQSKIDIIKGIKALFELNQSNSVEIDEKLKDIHLKISSLTIDDKLKDIHQTINSLTIDDKLKDIHQTINSLTIDDKLKDIHQMMISWEQQIESLEMRAVESQKRIQDLLTDKNAIVVKQSYFQGVEVGLMKHLYSFLPNKLAIDIGANIGDISWYLLETGYTVYAFEPFPPIFEKLKSRCQDHSNFHGFPFAIGSENGTQDLFIVSDQTSPKIYQDSSLYSSLVQHSLCDGLIFTDSVPVTVRTLESLHQSSDLPSDISLVKIDTEGFDLEVLKGMGDYTYPVVMAEFWDSNCPFGKSGARNQLHEMVQEMKNRNYGWYIVLYRLWGNTEVSYYCNHPYSLENSWGNVFFFKEYDLFIEAFKWCSATMPPTYLAV